MVLIVQNAMKILVVQSKSICINIRKLQYIYYWERGFELSAIGEEDMKSHQSSLLVIVTHLTCKQKIYVRA